MFLRKKIPATEITAHTEKRMERFVWFSVISVFSVAGGSRRLFGKAQTQLGGVAQSKT